MVVFGVVCGLGWGVEVVAGAGVGAGAGAGVTGAAECVVVGAAVASDAVVVVGFAVVTLGRETL